MTIQQQIDKLKNRSGKLVKHYLKNPAHEKGVSLDKLSGKRLESALKAGYTIYTPIEEPKEAIKVGEQNVNATAGAISFAKAQGIDLADVPGSGEDGRISKADVESYVQSNT